jgi:hypothetical protein
MYEYQVPHMYVYDDRYMLQDTYIFLQLPLTDFKLLIRQIKFHDVLEMWNIEFS